MREPDELRAGDLCPVDDPACLHVDLSGVDADHIGDRQTGSPHRQWLAAAAEAPAENATLFERDRRCAKERLRAGLHVGVEDRVGLMTDDRVPSLIPILYPWTCASSV